MGRDDDGDGGIDEIEQLRWNDEVLDGAAFKAWETFEPGESGEVLPSGATLELGTREGRSSAEAEWLVRGAAGTPCRPEGPASRGRRG